MSVMTIPVDLYAKFFRDTRDRYVAKYGYTPQEAYRRAQDIMDSCFRCDVIEAGADAQFDYDMEADAQGVTTQELTAVQRQSGVGRR
jgi:hypothetical protein